MPQANLPDLLMSIRFSDPEMSFFLQHQVLNDNWQQVTQILLWALEKEFIVPITDQLTGDFKYECQSPVVENLIRKLLAFGRGSFFNRQPLETQAIMAAVIDRSNSILPQTDLPPPPINRRKKK